MYFMINELLIIHETRCQMLPRISVFEQSKINYMHRGVFLTDL